MYKRTTIHNNRHGFPLAFFIAVCQYVVMVCTYCSSPTNIVNSRHQKRTNSVWRRHRCTNTDCGSVFTTHESIDLSSVLAVQHSARTLQPFSRDKLYMSIFASCKHRPTALADADGLVRTVIGLALGQQINGTISREEIITLTCAVLERFDKTAGTIYSAYHAAPAIS